jgi:NADPH:quinone reductase-like Zn-dependent oxidoreductase
MNAIVFEKTGGPEVLALADVPKPNVRPGMVLIRTHAIGVNFADTRFRQGTYAVKPQVAHPTRPFRSPRRRRPIATSSRGSRWAN